MGGAGSRPDVNADSRFPCKGRIAIFGRRPIWIKGPHGAGTAPLAVLASLLHDVTRDPKRSSPILSPSILTSANGNVSLFLSIALSTPLVHAHHLQESLLIDLLCFIKIARIFNHRISSDSNKRCWVKVQWAFQCRKGWWKASFLKKSSKRTVQTKCGLRNCTILKWYLDECESVNVNAIVIKFISNLLSF